MSTTIDKKVVEMRFDNKQFEQNVSTTMSSLDKLKQKLRLDGATKGLEEVNTAAKRVDMSHLGDSVDKVGLRFSALYTVADQYLRRITDSVINASSRIVKALTIDPVKMGFSEYETQIGAIQTILSNTKSKGTTLDDVNGALDELNAYADKTIYNFTEMTRNIGTFTAAGVDLDTSVSAIKGIANLAAVSGSTSQQASTTMYQLSQALASGTVKLMDWNSVVNAGMGGQVFQDALKETARVHNIAIDEIIKQEGSFRESLSTGWLSSEILTETLAKFTGDLNEEQLKAMGYTQEQIKSIIELGKDANDAATKVKTFSQLLDTLKEAAQSGWTQTWEIIIGDFEEAKALFSTVSDVISGMLGRSADARNEILENWKVLGGRQAIIDAIKYSFEAVVGVFKAISEASKEIFPPVTAEKLVAISEKIRDVAKAFDAFFHVRDENGVIVKTTKNFENLKRTFKGIFAVVDIVRQIFGALFKAIGLVFGATDELGGGLLAVTAVIGDWLVAFHDAITYSKIFENVFTGIAKLVRAAIQWFANLGSVVGESFIFTVVTESLNYLIDLIVTAGDETNNLANFARNVGEAWKNSGLYKFLSGVWTIVKSIGSGISKAFSGLFGGLLDAASVGDFETLFDIINGLLSGGLIVGLGSLVKTITELFGAPKSIIDAFKDVADTIDDVVGSIGDTFTAFQNKLKADALLSIAKAIGILAASILVITLIDQEKLEKAMAAILILMTVMTVMMKAISMGEVAGSIGKGGLSFSKESNGLIGLAAALLAAGIALNMVAKLSWDEIKRGVVGITGALGALLVAELILSRASLEGKQVKQGSKAMVTMAIAMIAMIVPIKVLGSMPCESMKQGILGVISVLSAMTLATTIFAMLGKSAGSSKGMLAGAAAVAIMGAALNYILPTFLIMSVLPFPLALQGCIGVISILGALAMMPKAFGKLAEGGYKNIIAGTAAILAMAFALQTITPTILMFSVIPSTVLIQGVLAAVAVLTALGTLPVILGKLGEGGHKNLLAGAATILAMALALQMITPAILVIGFIEWYQALQGVLTLTAVLAALSTTVILLNKFGGNGLGLMSAAKSILVMAAAVMLLAPALVLLGSMSVGQAAVAVGTLAVGLLALVGVAALVQKFVPTFFSFALSVQSIGLGTLMAGAGLLLFGAGLTTIAIGIAQLVPALAALVGSLGIVVVGIVALVAAVIEGVVRGIGAGIVALCEVLIESLPLIASTLVELVQACCKVVVECAPEIVNAILVLILKLIEGLRDYIPPIVSAALDLISGIIKAIADGIPQLADAFGEFANAFITGIVDALGKLDPNILVGAMSSITMLTIIMAELALMKFLAKPAMAGVLAAGVVLAELALVIGIFSVFSGMTDAIDKGGEALESVGRAIGKFVGGLIGGFTKGATEDLPDIATNLSTFATNIKDFITIAPTLAGAMKAFAGASIVDSIAKIFGLGKSSMDMFKDELPKLGTAMAGFSDKIGTRSFTNIEQAADGLSKLANAAKTMPRMDGWAGKLLGNIDMTSFGSGLTELATGLVGFSDEIGKASDPTFSNIENAVTAASALTEVASAMPEMGGLRGFIDGEVDITEFGTSLKDLGKGIADFAAEAGDVGDISEAIKAAKGIVNLTNDIPNEGGMKAWFTGDKSISKYSTDLEGLGTGIKKFAGEISGIETENLDPAIKAAEGIVNLTHKIPNEGGMVAWFTGDNAISKFAVDLGELGTGISNFATNSGEINTDNVNAAVAAGERLATMTQSIPNEGGVKAWFAGESGVAKFAGDLAMLGLGISLFSTNTDGISVGTVTAAAEAAERLASMTEHIPNEGGVKAWFAGESGVSKFAHDLGSLGTGISKFATNSGEIDPKKVEAATIAAEKLAIMTHQIPTQDGMKAWFAGEINVSKFAWQLPALGAGIAGFANNLGDADMSGVDKAAAAGKALAEMTQHIPNEGGIKAWFSGDTAFSKFAEQLPSIASGIAGFANNLGSANLANVEPAANAAKTLAEMTEIVPNKSGKIVDFGENLGAFGTKMKAFITNTADVTEGTLAGSKAIINIAKEASTIDAGNIKNVAKEIDNLASSVKKMEKNIKDDMEDAGENAIAGFIKGIENKLEDAKKSAESIASGCVTAISDKYSDFRDTAGKNAAQGFAAGMDKYAYLARNAANRMASGVLSEIASTMDSHSPSRETDKLGQYGGIGFVNGWLKYVADARDAGHEVGDSALSGLRNAISKVQTYIDSGMDTQPTITPVLDLSEVKSGAGLIGSMFNGTSLGVNANLGAIHSMMNARLQNGSNDDVIDAINELRDALNAKGGDTYQINGITYDDGSNIKEAVETLIRAARMERRV